MRAEESAAAELTRVRDALVALEPLFHHPDLTGREAADLEALAGPDFWEVGASGAVYTRDVVMRIVRGRYADGGGEDGSAMPVDEVRCRVLGPSTYLLTYRLRESIPDGRVRVTRRATVWERADSPVGWQVVYHQGTLVSEG